MAKQSTAAESSFKDYYEVLHLHPDADASLVDQVYWHLARLHSAAIRTDPSARIYLDDLNEAYAVLRSPRLRKQYDKTRSAALGPNALPPSITEQPEREPPPLAVMVTQHLQARQESEPPPAEHGRRRLTLPQPRLPHLTLPSFSRPTFAAHGLSARAWQTLFGTTVSLSLANVALLIGVPLPSALALFSAALLIAMLPLIRLRPRLPGLPQRRRFTPSIDADALRRSTAAMRVHWREETQGLVMPGSSREETNAPQPHDEEHPA